MFFFLIVFYNKFHEDCKGLQTKVHNECDDSNLLSCSGNDKTIEEIEQKLISINSCISDRTKIQNDVSFTGIFNEQRILPSNWNF